MRRRQRRLSARPRTRFSGALEDNYAALKWVANAAELGVDTCRIAVMGTSAGGGHVAMLSAAAKDRGEVPICFQLLLSPMLGDRTGSSRPMPPHIGAFIWTADANRFGWLSLLGVPAGSKDVPEGAVPSRRLDLRGLPPKIPSKIPSNYIAMNSAFDVNGTGFNELRLVDDAEFMVSGTRHNCL